MTGIRTAAARAVAARAAAARTAAARAVAARAAAVRAAAAHAAAARAAAAHAAAAHASTVFLTATALLIAACQGPPEELAPARCIGGLVPSDAAPSASLDAVPALLFRKPVSRGPAADGIALAGERIAVTVGSRLLLFDRAGKRAGTVPSFDLEPLSAPIAGPDGTFYVAGTAGYAVTPDGTVRWVRPFANPRAADSTTTGPFLASGDGATLYAAASDGSLWSLSAGDGAFRFRAYVGQNPRGPARLVAVAGDTVVAVVRAGSVPPHQLFDAATGAPVGRLHIDGEAIYVRFVGGRGPVAQRMLDTSGPYPWMHIYALDACGRVRFHLPPARPQWAGLLSPRDELVVAEREDVEASPVSLSVYAPEGRRLAGPAPGGAPWALGADGTIYAVVCPHRDDEMTPSRLVALTPTLGELWRLDLGPGCPRAGPAFAPDGVMYFLQRHAGGTDLVAVQTTSPGAAAAASFRASPPPASFDPAR